MKTLKIILLATAVLSLFTAAPFHAALAATAPTLGTAQSFAVLGGSTVTNANPTVIVGDLGVSPGSAVTGFPPGLVTGGTIHAADAVALQAQSDNTAAYITLAGQACAFDLTGSVLGSGGSVPLLTPGVYCFSSSAQLTGALTLDAQGNADAVWIFQIGSTLTTASNSSVLVINGAQPCNVFWQVGSSAALGTTTSFIGNILALTSISLTTGANVSGRALARNGAVTMDTNTVGITACTVPPVAPIPPTLGKAFSPATINTQGTPIDISTLTITLSNADATAATLTGPFIDTLPVGVTTVAGSQATTCVGGTGATATASSVTLALGASIPAGGSCTLTVNVTSASAATYINTLGIGALVTSNGSNQAPAVATLVVNPVTPPQPPFVTLAKAFSPATINEQGTPIDTSTLTITLSNPNNTVASLTAPLTDTLPPGVVVANPANAVNNCGGTFTAIPGALTVTLSVVGASIPANGSCTVKVDVTAAVGSSYFNTLAAGALVTSNGTNAAPAVATLTVLPVITVQPPTVSKTFNPTAIGPGGVSLLTITVTNPNLSSVATAAFNDTLPTSPGQMSVAAGSQTNTCGGTLSAATGAFAVILSGGSIPAGGSCTVKVNVTASVQGTFTNHLGAASATLLVSSVIFCEKLPVQNVLKPTGQYPGNLGPDYLVQVNHGDSVQSAVNRAALPDSATTGDINGDGYIIIAVRAHDDGTLGGSSTQNVVISAAYSKPFALIGCSVTLYDANLSDANGTIRITSSASSTAIAISEGAAATSNIFLMDLHGAGSNVAGVQVDGNNRYLRNEGGSGNTGVGFLITGNSNTMHNGAANSNKGDGVSIRGSFNYLTDTDSFGNGGNGFNVVGNSNKLLKLDAGDKGKGNTGDGIHVVGNSNTLSEIDAYANGDDGIDVAGNSNTLSKNVTGDKGKGNGSGIRTAGASNSLTENKASANTGAGFTIIGGTGNKLKSNATSNNTGNEYAIGAGNVDQGGNKKNGSSFTFTAAGGDFN